MSYEDLRGLLPGLEDALTEYLDDAEEITKGRRDRLQKVKDSLSPGTSVEASSSSLTEEYYDIFSLLIFPGS